MSTGSELPFTGWKNVTFDEALAELRLLRDREREIRAAVSEEWNRRLTLTLYQDGLLEAQATGRPPKTSEAQALSAEAPRYRHAKLPGDGPGR